MFLWPNESQLWLCGMPILMYAYIGEFPPPPRCVAMPAKKSRELNQAIRRNNPARQKTAPRRVSDGDTAPAPGADSIRRTVIRSAADGAASQQAITLAHLLARHAAGEPPGEPLDQIRALMAGASPDEVKALRRLGCTREELDEALAVCVYMGGGPALMYAAEAIAAWEAFAPATPAG